jgi:uncharacterized protein (TIGR04255 family)
MPESRTIYPNPPIQEAVCEIHFDPKQPFAADQKRLLQDVWNQEYPNQKLVDDQQLRLELSPEGIKSASQSLGQKLICRSEDGHRLVQVGSALLAVNQLKPYPGWNEGFRETILNRAADFLGIVGPRPFTRLVLRYINKIVIPQVPLVWEQWFQFQLPIPVLQNSRLGPFQMQFQAELEDDLRLVIAIAALPKSSESSPVILDLGVIWEGISAGPEMLRDHLERVHSPHRLAFEGYLNDNARRLFH